MSIFTVIGIITVATLAGTTASILFIWLKEKFSKGAIK